MADSNSASDDAINPPTKASPYAWYALGILFLVYVLNFIDRQIITILAPDLKRDLGLDDADIGFLYGTAFAVFYALFGIRRCLAPRPAADRRARHLVGNDRCLGARREPLPARSGANGGRRRRGDRRAFGLFADF
mgnify:CR=1 FL=1